MATVRSDSPTATVTGASTNPPGSRPAGTTRTLAGPAELEYWRHTVNAAFGPLEPVLRDDRPFHAALDVADLGNFSLLSVRATPHDVVRGLQAAGAAEARFFKILFQVSGSGVLYQNDRECLLRSGDLALSDTTRPYSLGQRENFHLSALVFPCDALPLPAAVVERFTGCVLPCRDGAGAVLSACMRHLQQYICERGDDGTTSHRLAAACMDLLAATLAQSGDCSTATPRAARRLQIVTWINDHLQDEDLSPATVAAANHISSRYLHRLFEDQEISVASYIRGQRLERVREDLEDRLLANRGISTIAARWGFYSQPHFTRMFR
ncbi:helix-turn-helix domain-containing protein, partial [Frankia sp. Cppng1_Ct_nod]|uniref:AraC-like ligand-binding domain-containing protein n=1 Tax=Frankia sp. Cppng1_Ct_nod TaxID=2897162 RepID=UPI0020249A39